MSEVYLKKAKKTPETGTSETRKIVERMLSEIEIGKETIAKKYASDLDGFNGDIIVSQESIENASKMVPEKLKDDIKFAHERIKKFAEAQKQSISEFETELSPGLWAGQKLIPIQTAGCYVPGGRYAHVASAIMSITTARVAGVENIIACSAPKGEDGPNPAILYTMNYCGADKILVGPGNRFVAEAKRTLFGKVGIDLFAGPTEIAIIADESADADIVAEDLVSQAEHGPDSPAWLISTSEKLANDVISIMDKKIQNLPETSKKAAELAWKDYGEIILCNSDEEAARVSDIYAAEHLEVHTSNNDWFSKRLKNYGSLFVGEETTVTFGDKCSGTNHILPTKGAAHYTGGLSVHKFMKIVTTQRMTREANKSVAQVAARISRLEGMEAHARSGDIRLKKYFPDENFDVSPVE